MADGQVSIPASKWNPPPLPAGPAARGGRLQHRRSVRRAEAHGLQGEGPLGSPITPLVLTFALPPLHLDFMTALTAFLCLGGAPCSSSRFIAAPFDGAGALGTVHSRKKGTASGNALRISSGQRTPPAAASMTSWGTPLRLRRHPKPRCCSRCCGGLRPCPRSCSSWAAWRRCALPAILPCSRSFSPCMSASSSMTIGCRSSPAGVPDGPALAAAADTPSPLGAPDEPGPCESPPLCESRRCAWWVWPSSRLRCAASRERSRSGMRSRRGVWMLASQAPANAGCSRPASRRCG